jgi:hypothetical protein
VRYAERTGRGLKYVKGRSELEKNLDEIGAEEEKEELKEKEEEKKSNSENSTLDATNSSQRATEAQEQFEDATENQEQFEDEEIPVISEDSMEAVKVHLLDFGEDSPQKVMQLLHAGLVATIGVLYSISVNS